MTSASRFIVELTPPRKLEDLDKFYARISNLVRLTGQVSITSKRFLDRTNFVLAKHLLQRNPTIDILFHLTASDTDPMLAFIHLSMLKEAGIKRLLLITGDGHWEEVDDEDAWKWFSTSYELLQDVVRLSGKEFQTIAIAGYPGGDGRRSYNNQTEVERLSKKLEIRADTIYTQCLFDDETFRDFSDRIRSKFPQVEIVPSVALFKDLRGLEKIVKYTRVSGASIQCLRYDFTSYIRDDDEESGYEYSIKFLEGLCRKLFKSGASKIDLCTFGNYDMAVDLIMRLEKNPTTL